MEVTFQSNDAQLCWLGLNAAQTTFLFFSLIKSEN